MAKTMTQARNTPDQPDTSGVWKEPIVPLGRSYTWIGAAGGGCKVPRQTTTSFRSGRTERISKETEEDQLPTNQLQAQAYYRKAQKATSPHPGDTGHAFHTTKEFLRHLSAPVVLSNSTGSRSWTGPLFCDTRYHATSGVSFASPTPFSSQSYYGAQAINATLPTKSATSLAVALAELKREGLPSLTGYQTIRGEGRPSQRLGGEYLNNEFGWKPLIGAVQDTAKAVGDASRIISQYQRDSGRIVRRKFVFPQETTTTAVTKSAQVWNPPNSSNFSALFFGGSLNGTLTEVVQTTTDIWFSGAYSYHLPRDDNHGSRLVRFEAQANRLLGTRITPDTIYQVTPWSWLIDWNVNLGTVIANATALGTDGLVIRWGYLMRSEKIVRTTTLRGVRRLNGETLPPITSQFVTHTKERVRANPFGFGSNPASYTGRQWAILAALGMTRSPQAMHGD